METSGDLHIPASAPAAGAVDMEVKGYSIVKLPSPVLIPSQFDLPIPGVGPLTFEYLARGSFNFVYKTKGGHWVGKTSIDSETDEDITERQRRLHLDINPKLPTRIVSIRWPSSRPEVNLEAIEKDDHELPEDDLVYEKRRMFMMPFISDEMASDEEVAQALLDLYFTKGRIIVDGCGIGNFLLHTVAPHERQVICVDMDYAKGSARDSRSSPMTLEIEQRIFDDTFTEYWKSFAGLSEGCPEADRKPQTVATIKALLAFDYYPLQAQEILREEFKTSADLRTLFAAQFDRLLSLKLALPVVREEITCQLLCAAPEAINVKLSSRWDNIVMAAHEAIVPGKARCYLSLFSSVEQQAMLERSHSNEQLAQFWDELKQTFEDLRFNVPPIRFTLKEMRQELDEQMRRSEEALRRWQPLQTALLQHLKRAQAIPECSAVGAGAGAAGGVAAAAAEDGVSSRSVSSSPATSEEGWSAGAAAAQGVFAVAPQARRGEVIEGALKAIDACGHFLPTRS